MRLGVPLLLLLLLLVAALARNIGCRRAQQQQQQQRGLARSSGSRAKGRVTQLQLAERGAVLVNSSSSSRVKRRVMRKVTERAPGRTAALLLLLLAMGVGCTRSSPAQQQQQQQQVMATALAMLQVGESLKLSLHCRNVGQRCMVLRTVDVCCVDL
jgi:uncharacterized protein YcfL